MFLRHTPSQEATGGVLLTVVPTNRLARQLGKASILSAGSRAITPPLFHTLETLAQTIYQEVPDALTLVAGNVRLYHFERAVRSAEKTGASWLSPGTFNKMLAAVTILQESGVSADMLATDLPSMPAVERARLKPFLDCYRAYEDELRRARAADAAGIFMHLRDVVSPEELARAFRSAFPDVREVLLTRFDDFADPEIDVIERLRAVPGLIVTVHLRVEPENPALFGYVSQHAERLQRLGFSAGAGSTGGGSLFAGYVSGFPVALAGQLFTRKTGAMAKEKDRIDIADRVTLIECRTRWHEVTAICRLIKRLVAEKPDRELSAICVAFPRPEIYTDVIRERFAAYGIPSNITDRFELSGSPLVTDILGMMEMRRGDFQRDDVLRILHSPFLAFGEKEAEEIDRGNLVDISRRLRVTGALELWLRKIDAEVSRRRPRRAASVPGGGDHQDASIRALLKARADLLRLEDITKVLEGDFAPPEFEAAVLEFLQELRVVDRLTSARGVDETQERDARAYARFLSALHETVLLAQAGSGNARHGFGHYLDLLKNAVSRERYNVRERRMQGVLVTAMEEARGMPVEVMILAGMEDSSIPGVAEPELFLSRRLSGAREGRRVQRLRNLFFQCVGNWTEQLYLSHPRRDAGVDLVRSSFLDSLLESASVRVLDDFSPEIAGDALSSEEEFLSWHGDARRRGTRGLAVPRRLQEKARLVERSRRIEQSRMFTHEFGEYEGVIGGVLSPPASRALRRLSDTPLSVTDLETYGTCPFKFMAGGMLGLRSPSEYLEDISAVERGFVVHDVLFEFFRGRRERNLPPVSRLSDREFEEAVKELESLAERRLDRLDILGPFWELERDIILGASGRGLLRSFLEVERERTDRMRPGFFEVAFGQPGDRPGSADPELSTPAAIRIGKVNLRGRIDRLDVGEECFVVIDYKTGSLLPTFAEIRSGKSLQLPLYMRAAAELLAGEGEVMEPAAGLYYRLREPVALTLALGSATYGDIAFTPPHASRRVLKTQKELLEVIEAAVERANAYVEAMKHGLFPLTPPEHRATACRYCEFRTICRVTTVRQEPYDHQEDQ